jgi:peptidoglycan/xylan/chitin deacetylase (PgdA/CDA1 family)
VNHEILTEIDPDLRRDEIERSLAELREQLNPPVLTFAYPNGNYDDSIRRLVINAGARCAVSTVPGIASPASDRYALPRVNVHDGVSRGAFTQFSPSLFDAHIHRVFG